MILFRYLSRDVLKTLLAVSAVLLVIIMSGRFVKYLAQAAQGQFDPGALLAIMAYRIPGTLQLILPLGLFISILLVYGRMYVESEMSALSAAGISQTRLLRWTLAPAALVALLSGWFSLAVTPYGYARVEQILTNQDKMSEFDVLMPGRFQSMRGSTRVVYTETLSSERHELSGVFISEQKRATKDEKTPPISLLMADSGRIETQPDGNRYLVLENGYRYDGLPGQANYQVIHYDRYGALLPKPEFSASLIERDSMPTRHLFNSDNPEHIAELQWRLSMPLVAFIITLLAVPLAYVRPRQGRFARLLPAIVLYMTYLALLITARSFIETGKIPPFVGMWWIHALFLALGLFLLFRESLHLRWIQYRTSSRT